MSYTRLLVLGAYACEAPDVGKGLGNDPLLIYRHFTPYWYLYLGEFLKANKSSILQYGDFAR